MREGRERDLIFVEGERLVGECIASGLRLEACFCLTELAESMRARVQCEVFEVAESVLESLSDTQNSQGVIRHCRSVRLRRSIKSSRASVR